MKQFQIHFFEGHLIIIDGENTILVDTGAPTTIHASTHLNFCSKSYNCVTSHMGLNVAKLSNILGTEITTLLGVDILADYKVFIDYQNKIIKFSTKEIDIEGSQTDISNFMGIPIIELNIDNQQLKFFLDTGAKLSYLSNHITRNYKMVGVDEDFYPGLGKFNTECFEIPTSLDKHNFMVKYGNLPNILQKTLMLGKTDGIIGFDFFNNFKVIIDLKNNKLKYAK